MEEGKLIGQDSDVDKCDQILRWRFNFTGEILFLCNKKKIKWEDGRNRTEF